MYHDKSYGADQYCDCGSECFDMKRLFAALFAVLASLAAFGQVPITSLPSMSTPPSGAEVLPLVQSGTTKQGTLDQLLNQNFVAQILFPQTAAEASAGVTPSNYVYSPCNINRYGTNTTPGTTDMTTALQNALNACTDVYIPGGTYLISTVTLPVTYFQTIRGDGVASILQQKAGAAAAMLNFSNTGSCCDVLYRWIKDMAWIGTNGSQHIFSSVGESAGTLQNITIFDAPASNDDIYINGSNSTYNHDWRIIGIQHYHASSVSNGNAVIELGSLTSDIRVERVIGGAYTNYCLLVDSGGLTGTFNDSHPYGCADNVVKLAGNNSYWLFNNNTFDGGTTSGHLVTVGSGAGNILFTNNYFEAIQNTYDGVLLTGTLGVSLINNQFATYSTSAASAFAESGANDTFVMGGQIGTAADYTSPCNLSGLHSYYQNVIGCPTLSASLTYSSGCSSGTFAPTLTYTVTGNVVTGRLSSSTCTSTASSIVATGVPSAIQPAATQNAACFIEDNSATLSSGVCNVNGSSLTLELPSAASFSGTSGSTVATSFTYTLQ